ncbi:MAG: SUMF1/EgtB/PvdO family nonheme iron enzyme [Lentisphaerae bacterium]|nr:SUMF1/EgtB/PvdO family nonheme iron enzyme [Lentisphaerota bacterium]
MKISKTHCVNMVLSVLLIGSVWLTGGCGGSKRSGIKSVLPEKILDFDGLKIAFVQVEPDSLWVGKYEISNIQFKKVMPNHFSGYHEGVSLDEPDLPVVSVTWKDAKKFCDFLNKTLKNDENFRFKFRLPTEAEWMNFATSGKNTIFPWGDKMPPPSDWNYYGEENKGFGMKLRGHDDGFKYSTTVGRCGVNAWGIYGAGDNIKEWCENAYDESGDYKTIKGASWADSHPDFLATANRNYYEPDYKFINLGFRVVVEVEPFTDEEKIAIADKMKAEKERAEAEKEKLELEQKQKVKASKELAEKERRDKRLLYQNEVQRLVNRREYDKADKQLQAYFLDFGKDAFYEEWHGVISSIKVVRLSDSVLLEFVKIPALDIWAGRYEITNQKFKQFKPLHDSGNFREHSLAGDEQPVVNISWHDANEFCDWLNNNFKDQIPATHVFKLPTEQEWEKIASGGTDSVFPWGNAWPPQEGNYGIMQDYDDGFVVTCPVMDSGKNVQGIFGLGGNVWEWTEDWNDSTMTAKIFKGGAWNQTNPESLKIISRNADSPDTRTPYVGFRVIISKF